MARSMILAALMLRGMSALALCEDEWVPLELIRPAADITTAASALFDLDTRIE